MIRWFLAVAAVSFLVAGAVIVLTVAGGNQVLVLDLDVGDCVDLPLEPGDELLDLVDPVPCADPHEAEVVAVGELNPDRDRELPADPALFDLVDVRCAVATEGQAYLADFGIVPVAPNEPAWTGKQGRFVCLAIPYGGGRTTGSVLVAPTV